MADDIINPVSGIDAYDALALIIAEHNPYAVPDQTTMPDLTGTLEQLKARNVKFAGWLAERAAKPDGDDDFIDETGNLIQVCNEQMTISEKQQSFYWTILEPTNAPPKPENPHTCTVRNETPADPNGAKVKTYQICKAIVVPFHYNQAGQNPPGGGRQELEGFLVIGYAGSGGH